MIYFSSISQLKFLESDNDFESFAYFKTRIGLTNTLQVFGLGCIIMLSSSLDFILWQKNCSPFKGDLKRKLILGSFYCETLVQPTFMFPSYLVSFTPTFISLPFLPLLL